MAEVQDRPSRRRATRQWLLDSPKLDLDLVDVAQDTDLLTGPSSSAAPSMPKGRRPRATFVPKSAEDSLLLDTSFGMGTSSPKRGFRAAAAATIAREKRAVPGFAAPTASSRSRSSPLKEVATVSSAGLDEMSEQELERLAWLEMQKKSPQQKKSPRKGKRRQEEEPQVAQPGPASPTKIPRLNASTSSQAPRLSVSATLTTAAESREARRRRLGLAPILPSVAEHAAPSDAHDAEPEAAAEDQGSRKKRRAAREAESQAAAVEPPALPPVAAPAPPPLSSAVAPVPFEELPRSVSPRRKQRRNAAPSASPARKPASSSQNTVAPLASGSEPQHAVHEQGEASMEPRAIDPVRPRRSARNSQAQSFEAAPIPIASLAPGVTADTLPQELKSASEAMSRRAREAQAVKPMERRKSSRKSLQASKEAKFELDKRKAIKLAASASNASKTRASTAVASVARRPQATATTSAPAGFRVSSTGKLVPAPPARIFSFDANAAAAIATESGSEALTARQRALLEVQRAREEAAQAQAEGLQERAQYCANDVPAWLRKRKEQLQAEEAERLEQEIERIRAQELERGKKAASTSRKSAAAAAAQPRKTSASGGFVSSIEARIAERAEWERKRKAKEDMLAAVRDEARAEKARMEEEEYQEARRRAVPKANPVPAWIYGGQVSTQTVASDKGKGKARA